MTDTWDVLDGYRDVSGQWHTTDPDVAAACRTAMGTPPQDPSMVFTRANECRAIDGRGELTLEDGSTLEVDAALPPDLPLGYHELHHPNDLTTFVVVAPERAAAPVARSWGWSVQLPALHDESTWGIGDLGSFTRFGQWAHQTGADYVLTSPLHAPLNLTPRDPSPYFPSSRIWRDPSLIAIDNPTDTPGMDRDGVWQAKRARLWRQWVETSGSSDPAFLSWRAQNAESLEPFVQHEVIAETFTKPWTEWPRELRHPSNPEVADFAALHQELMSFHAWLQWQVEMQLAQAGSTVGVMTDLAIGVNPRGADAWRFQDQFANGVQVGAPPDEFNPAGQAWGLCPFAPRSLRAARYRPFIEAVRANLAHAKALRMDHVMGLFRLYWIPEGNSPKDGAYVRMPAEELLDLVCLESVRAGAAIVGEDLGTVEDSVHAAMEQHGILGTRLVWFEDDPPSLLPRACLASITTHDLPTVVGLITGSDAAERASIGVAVEVAADASMLDRLTDAAREGHADHGGEPIEIAVAATRALASSPAEIVLSTLDDALGVGQRPNIPGTTTERPNWSLPVPIPVDQIPTNPGIIEMVTALSSRASRGAAGEPTQ